MNEKYYYWLDTEFNYGDFSVPKCALIRGERDEDGEKDRCTEEVIAWTAYEDIGVEILSGEDYDENDTEKKLISGLNRNSDSSRTTRSIKTTLPI